MMDKAPPTVRTVEMHNCCPSCGHNIFGNAWCDEGNAVCRKCNRVFYFTVGQPGIYKVLDYITADELDAIISSQMTRKDQP